MKKSSDPKIPITIRLKTSTAHKAFRIFNSHEVLPGSFSEYLRHIIEEYIDRKR